jgi:hypothetical protein
VLPLRRRLQPLVAPPRRRLHPQRTDDNLVLPVCTEKMVDFDVSFAANAHVQYPLFIVLARCTHISASACHASGRVGCDIMAFKDARETITCSWNTCAPIVTFVCIPAHAFSLCANWLQHI